MDSIGATWALICWTAPSGDSMISRYEILAREVNGSGLVNVTTGNNSTFFNVTGLLPATTYSLSVVAVAEGGVIVARGSESEPEVDMTGVTGVFVRGREEGERERKEREGGGGNHIVLS